MSEGMTVAMILGILGLKMAIAIVVGAYFQRLYHERDDAALIGIYIFFWPVTIPAYVVYRLYHALERLGARAAKATLVRRERARVARREAEKLAAELAQMNKERAKFRASHGKGA